MSTTEQIYELLIQANPVPHPDALLPDLPTAAPNLHVLDPGRSPMQTQDKVTPIPSTQPRKRWVPAVAAAAAVVIIIAAVTLVLDRTGDDPAPVVDTPAPELDPNAEREAAAVAAVERFHAAINAGDMETIVALAQPDEADLQMFESNAAMAAEYPQEVRRCVAAITTEELVRVECEVVMSAPVFVALGVGELVFPWQVYADGLVEWRPWEGVDPGEINRAYRDYLRLHHLEAYEEVCDPSRYTFGTINFDGGMAFTAPCAELQLSVEEDVAAWIEAGRPEG